MNRRRLARVFWIGAAASLVVAALIALAAVLRGNFSDTDGRILGTLAALLLAGGTLISGLVLVERDNALLGRVAAVVSPIGLGLLVYAIWDHESDALGKALAVLWILTGVCYFLIPVLERFRAETPDPDVRVLASLDDVELVLTTSNNGLVVELAPGERLLRRRRP